MEYPAATACQLPLECSTFGKARDDFPRGVYGNGSRFLTFQTRFSDAGAKHTMLHRILSLSFVALALTLFIGQAALAADKVHEGTVVKAGDGKLTMTDKKGSEHSHVIPAEAIITLDGMAADGCFRVGNRFQSRSFPQAAISTRIQLRPRNPAGFISPPAHVIQF